ncbi:MAG TPA: endo-1,4-beta-xylanase [Limnochordia bacterium]
MSRRLTAAALLLLGLAGAGPAGGQTPAPPTEGLRHLAAGRDLWIGAAVAYAPTAFPTDSRYVNTLAREFNVLVAENVMKWQTIRRDGRASWRFQFGDELVAFAQSHGMRVRGHVLAWHSGIPSWLARASFSREEAIALLEEHIARVVGRWKGRIWAWDVVNEAIADGPAGSRRSPQESVWERWIGEDWIDVAFRAAAAADPDALLFYNDYNIEAPFSAKQNAVYNLIAGLQARGVPIHGVGFQGHFVLGQTPSKAALMASMDRFAALGLIVQVTELDIRMSPPITPAKLAQQAEESRRVVEACLEHPACDTVVLWGIDDGHSWRAGGAPLLFDARLEPKPAYFAVREALAGRPGRL